MTNNVISEMNQLADLSTHELRLEWRRHHRGDTPDSLSRDLLIRSLAYKLQEQAHGGLGQKAKRSLLGLGSSAGKGGRPAAPVLTLRAGVRLVREWRGEAHVVLVLDKDFEYRDARYGSLTQIAKHITGAHWSGPRFFGLTSASQDQVPPPVVEETSHLGADHGKG